MILLAQITQSGRKLKIQGFSRSLYQNPDFSRNPRPGTTIPKVKGIASFSGCARTVDIVESRDNHVINGVVLTSF